MHKTFRILNQIISHYSVQPITTSSLDSCLTIQIISQCMLELGQLGLTKGQFGMIKKIVKKIYSKKSNPIQQFAISNTEFYEKSIQTTNVMNCNQQNKVLKQENKVQFTVFMIHQYNYEQQTNTNRMLCQKLMKDIDNLILCNIDGNAINNILYHDINKEKVNKIINNYKQRGNQNIINYPNIKSNYLLILSLNQASKFQQNISSQDKQKYIYKQLQLYSQICDIYHGHLNLRIMFYTQNKSPIIYNQNTNDKLKYFISCIQQYSKSQDDLDILLRQQVPTDAFIRVIIQRANRVNQKSITNDNGFQILKYKQNISYAFKINHKTNKNYLTDQILIWVLINNVPYLKLLPILNQTNKKRGKIGSKNEKYEQHRSNLGYTKIQMEERLIKKYQSQNQSSTNCSQNQAKSSQLNQNQNDSLYLCNSQSQLSQNSFKQQKQIDEPLLTYIINIVNKNQSPQQISMLIKQQMKQVLQIYLKQWKQIYQNLQINKSIMLIGKIRDLLNVNQKDVYHLLYLNKL